MALVYLCARLIHGGFSLLDTQFVTEHLRQFGTIEIDRAEFHTLLEAALAHEPISCACRRTPTPSTSSTSSKACRFADRRRVSADGRRRRGSSMRLLRRRRLPLLAARAGAGRRAGARAAPG